MLEKHFYKDNSKVEELLKRGLYQWSKALISIKCYVKIKNAFKTWGYDKRGKKYKTK